MPLLIDLILARSYIYFMNQGKKQRITELQLKNSLMSKSPGSIIKIKERLLSQKKSESILKIWLDIILDECLELSKLRQAFKMRAQLQEAIQDGIEEEEKARRTKEIDLVTKDMDESDRMLFVFFKQTKQQTIRFDDTIQVNQSSIHMYQYPLEDNQDSEILNKLINNQSFKKHPGENEKVSSDLMVQLTNCLAYDEENKKKIIFLEKQKKTSDAQIERLRNLLNTQKANNDQLAKKHTQLTKLHRQCNDSNINIQKFKEIERLYKNLEVNSNRVAIELKDVRCELEKEKLNRQDCESQLKRQQDKNNVEKCKLINEIQLLKKLNSSLKIEITQASKRQAEALRKNQELINKISNLRDYERYFAHEVLYGYIQYKKAIVDTIESRNYNNIKATRLLYRLDTLNKTNFHRYIDQIPHILLLVKLENGRMLACYTNEPFKPQCVGEDAFIMAVNTGNLYEVKKGHRAISYDEYYILFGNSEIRMRTGENLIFSNFGIPNTSFDHKGNSVDALFGEGNNKRELPISSYEIYQIILDEEQ